MMMKKPVLFLKVALFFVVTLLLNSCLKDNSNTEYPDVIATDLSINGTLKYKQLTGDLVAWPYGAATLKAIVGIKNVIATANVDIDGKFNLTLPGTLSGNYLYSLAATAASLGGTVVSTPNTIRYLNYIEFNVEYTDNGITKNKIYNLYQIKPDFTVEKAYYFNFFDDPGTFTGKSMSSNVFNWSFGKGWAMIENVVTDTTSGEFTSRTVTDIPVTAVWINN